MFGCLRRLGCLAVLVAGALGAWWYRDRWLPLLPGRHARVADRAPEGTSSGWEPISPAGAARARASMDRLARRTGAVFENLRPGDLASYIYEELQRQLPASARDVQTTVIGDRIYVRAQIDLRDLGGARALGPLAAMLPARDTMQLGGRLHVVRPGVAEFLVEDVKLGQLTVPPQAIPRLVREVRSRPTPPGIAANGLPLQIPRYVADVRVARGKITVYRDAQ